MKKALALFLALLLSTGLLVTPALAVQEEAETQPEIQAISPWAYDSLADIYALGMWSDEYYFCILDPVTDKQMDAICAAVAEKLALLNVVPFAGAAEPLVIDQTRTGVMNALYLEAAAYDMPYAGTSVDFMLRELGVAYGDGTGNDIGSRTCTLQEALVMASRLVLSLYDYYNAGSLGFLWKAVGGTNTLYLLGTIHVDRSNIYPFHSQLRALISNADAAFFELNLNDTEGMMQLAFLQIYTDGSTLADHISPSLYAEVVEALAAFGMPEEQVSAYKPWALANAFQSLALIDESTGGSIMAVDSYVNAKAVNAGVPIGAVETYEYQGNLFDTLSDEYQEEYLAASLSLYQGADTGNQAVSGELEDIDAWMDAWKIRDVDSFAASFDKDAYLTGEDELGYKLFAERDPNMIAAAVKLLEAEGENTFLMAVGAGHMIGDTGIVQGLINLGYTVEVVKTP